MEFNNYTQMKLATYPTKFEPEMLNVVMGMILWAWILWFLFGWCRDPLAEELQKKIRQLDDQIESLNNHLESSQEECDFLRERLSAAGHHIRALKRVLNTDSESDTESVRSCKRPRFNT